MSDSNLPESMPQFTTAEYAQPRGDQCAACKQPLTAQYYRVNGKMACPSCTERLQRTLPQDSHAAYVRGILFGVGAAILGMIFYAGFTILTGLYVGYVSLAVGWFVAKAIMLGSKGIGGRRYQILAVLLTYAAVSLAAVPIAISAYVKAKDKISTAQTQKQSTAADQAAHPEQSPDAPAENSRAAALGRLLLLGLASPFLELQDPLHGAIGLLILFVGIRIAWRMTQNSRSADIQGPYDNSAAASSMR
jgi:hypothetical protein